MIVSDFKFCLLLKTGFSAVRHHPTVEPGAFLYEKIPGKTRRYTEPQANFMPLDGEAPLLRSSP